VAPARLRRGVTAIEEGRDQDMVTQSTPGVLPAVFSGTRPHRATRAPPRRGCPVDRIVLGTGVGNRNQRLIIWTNTKTSSAGRGRKIRISRTAFALEPQRGSTIKRTRRREDDRWDHRARLLGKGCLGKVRGRRHRRCCNARGMPARTALTRSSTLVCPGRFRVLRKAAGCEPAVASGAAVVCAVLCFVAVHNCGPPC
jgi:hypothetical protein